MKLLVFLTMLLTAPLFGGPVFKYNEKRAIIIDGPIEALDEKAEDIRKWSLESTKPIFIVINSYGGSVIDGLKVVTAINQAKARKARVYCAVTDAAMSMATHILTACSGRYALKTSLIMWHPIAVNLMFASLTEKSTKRFNKQLVLLSEHLDKELMKALGLDKKVFDEYHENEYIQLATDLDQIAPKFLKIVDDIRPRK